MSQQQLQRIKSIIAQMPLKDRPNTLFYTALIELVNLTTAQEREIAELKEQIASLRSKLVT